MDKFFTNFLSFICVFTFVFAISVVGYALTPILVAVILMASIIKTIFPGKKRDN